MKSYEQYKPSGVAWLGDVPKHWELTRIKYIAELTPSKSDITDFEKECSFVPMEKLKLGNITLDENRMVREVINSYTYFKNGDLLIAKVTPCFENKNFAIAENLVNGIGFGSSEIYVLRPKNCNVRYLFYRLQDNAFMELATGAMMGAGGLKRVPSDFLNNFTIAMPSEPEQTVIAAYLDERTAYLDRLIAKQQALSEKLSEKRTALITEAVCGRLSINTGNAGSVFSPTLRDSGIQWLGEIPEHWEVKRLKYLLSEKLKYGANESAELDDKDLPRYIRITDIRENGTLKEDTFKSLEYEKAEEYLLDNFDILLARSGATVGKSYLYQKSLVGVACYAGYLIRARFKQEISNPEFINYVFQSSFYWEWVKAVNIQATIQNVSAEKYNEFTLALPPLEEQTAIATFLDKETAKIDRLQAKIVESVERLREYRTALITQAVTGKVRV